MNHSSKSTSAERLQIYFTQGIQLSLAAAIIAAVFLHLWLAMFMSALMLMTTFLPKILERRKKLTLPIEFELAVTVFIYASLF